MRCKLRDYQVDGLQKIQVALKATPRVLFCLPTGGGKTTMFAHIADRYQKAGRRVIIFAHRKLLVEQIVARLAEWGITAGLISGGERVALRHLVQVAMIQTMSARLEKLLPNFADTAMKIVDEAHHAPSAQMSRVLEALPGKLIGFTATPQRLDGKPLNPPFRKLVLGEPMGKLIRAGYLAPFRLVLPEGMHDPHWGKIRSQEITAKERTQAEQNVMRFGDAVSAYKQYSNGKRAIAFCYSVKDSERVAGRFRQADIAAECVHGEQDKAEVARIFQAYRRGEVLVLTCCNLIDEGIDLPETQTVIAMAKTQSLTKFRQTFGRGTRPKPDGSAMIYIDCVGNSITHGLPTEEVKWKWEKAEEKETRNTAPRVVICRHCRVGNSPGRTLCRGCGKPLIDHRALGMEIEVAEKEARLLEVDLGEFVRLRSLPPGKRREEIKKARTRAELQRLAKIFGYKDSYVDNILRIREEYRQKYNRGVRG